MDPGKFLLLPPPLNKDPENTPPPTESIRAKLGLPPQMDVGPYAYASEYHINHQFLTNAQGCQLGTLQILILHGLMISNQSKPIVGPLLQG